ncbi:MAG: hypothetical protein M3321_04360 [Actinomycetota bacterium]|nr:hypothetical protein [Actinomycetota bacterium]
MRVYSALLAILAAALAVASPASADFNSGLYSHDDGGCASRVDPITAVFYVYGTADRSLNHVRNHTGWTDGGLGGGQYFASHGVCGPTYGEKRGSGGWHIRARKTYDDDVNYGTSTVGTPHHEDIVWCGHAVDKGGVETQGGLPSGFDQGRQAIVNAFYGAPDHYFGGYQYWGNTQEMRQCDGDPAGSNGNVVWFTIPNYYH